MKKIIGGLILSGSIFTSLHAFSTGVYSCYSGGHKSIFTLLPGYEAILQEYGRKEYDGLWTNYYTKAKVVIEQRKATEYIIEPNKEMNSNRFLIYKLRNNSKYYFCKAKYKPLD